MNSTETLKLNHVTQTAWMTAAMRVVESRHANPIFRDDPTERLLAACAPSVLASFEDQKHLRSFVGSPVYIYLVMRTQQIDREILRLIAANEVDTILNLGAGLDMRSYRLSLPKDLHWIEADHSTTIELKNQQLAAEHSHCRLTRVSIDLSESEKRQALFGRVTAESSKVLILTEGLLPYLPESAVRELAHELHSQAELGHWLMDFTGRFFMKQTLRVNAQIRDSKIRTQIESGFSPPSLIDFMKSENWSLQTSLNTLEWSKEHDRMSKLTSALSPESKEVLEDCGVALFER